MANKKSKAGKGKPGKASGKKPSPPVKDDKQDAAAILNPAERVSAVRPMWEQRQHDDRVQLLTVDVETLRQQAKTVAEKQRANAALEPGVELADYVLADISLEDVLEEGLRRLKTKETWKVWQFDGQEFYDAESFRTHIHEHHIKEDLLRLLPKDDPKGTVERPAEAALRQRMTDLLNQVQLNSRQAQDEQQGGQQGRNRRAQRSTPEQAAGLVRDGNVEMISTMLQALEKEHDQLYHSILKPITTFVIDLLPEEMRETRPAELHNEDLEKIPPEDVTHIAEWLTEKVDALSSRLKAEQREDEEEDDGEPMGDVDLFALNADSSALTVNSKWLQHLEERLLGEDGHPRKAREGEDPHRMGLVLEWVYGSIVSTAEKSRDGAKRQLGLRPPTAQQAYENLILALQDQATWEQRAKNAKALLNDILRSRKEADELSKKYDIKPVPGLGGSTAAASEAAGQDGDSDAVSIPDEVIIKMLEREALLTQAKLHALEFDRVQGGQQLMRLKSQIRQGEPELDRLKREVEVLKHAPRSLENTGTFRTAAEMERHKHQMADAAIEEQLEVQTAFREQGAKLQSLYDKKQRIEFEMAKRETEIKQLNGWRATVENLRERFDDFNKQIELLSEIEANQQACHSSRAAALGELSADAAAVAAEEGTAGPLAAGLSRGGLMTAQHTVQRNKLRQHFHKDVRKQLYSDTDDRNFFNRIKDALKTVETRLEEGRVALQHLELFLVNVACDDPGAAIGSQLVLPLLQERLDAAALEYKAERAKMAEEEIIAMEAAAAASEAAERERKKQQLQKKKGKTKTDKERQATSKAAQAAAEIERRQREELERKQREEDDRRRRLEQLELIRKREEELMAQRRQQLMAEDGYWAQRMAEEQQRAALAMTIGDVDTAALQANSDSNTVSSSSSSTAGDANGTRTQDASSEDGTVSISASANALAEDDGFVLASSYARGKRSNSSTGKERADKPNGDRVNSSAVAAASSDRQQQHSQGRGFRAPKPYSSTDSDRATADRVASRRAAAAGSDHSGADGSSMGRQPRGFTRPGRDGGYMRDGEMPGRSMFRDGSREGFRGHHRAYPGAGQAGAALPDGPGHRQPSPVPVPPPAAAPPPPAPAASQPAAAAAPSKEQDSAASAVSTQVVGKPGYADKLVVTQPEAAAAAAASEQDVAADQQQAAWAKAAEAVAAAANHAFFRDDTARTVSAAAAQPAALPHQQQQQQLHPAGLAANAQPAASTTPAVTTDPEPAATTAAAPAVAAPGLQSQVASSPRPVSVPGSSSPLPPSSQPVVISTASESQSAVEAPTTPAPTAPAAHMPSAVPVTTVVVKETAVVAAGVEPPVSVKSLTFGAFEDALDGLELEAASSSESAAAAADPSTAGAACSRPPADITEGDQAPAAVAVKPQPQPQPQQTPQLPRTLSSPSAAAAAAAPPHPAAVMHPAAAAAGPGSAAMHAHGPPMPHHMAMRPMGPPGMHMQPMMAGMPHMMMAAAAAAAHRGHAVPMGPGPVPQPMAAAAAGHAHPQAAAAAAGKHQQGPPPPPVAGGGGVASPAAAVSGPVHPMPAGMRPAMAPSAPHIAAAAAGAGYYARPTAQAAPASAGPQAAAPAGAAATAGHAQPQQQHVRDHRDVVGKQQLHHQQQQQHAPAQSRQPLQQQQQPAQHGPRGAPPPAAAAGPMSPAQPQQQQPPAGAGSPAVAAAAPSAVVVPSMMAPPAVAMIPGMAPLGPPGGMLPGFAGPHPGMIMPPPAAMAMVPGVVPSMGPGGLLPPMPVHHGPRGPAAMYGPPPAATAAGQASVPQQMHAPAAAAAGPTHSAAPTGAAAGPMQQQQQQHSAPAAAGVTPVHQPAQAVAAPAAAQAPHPQQQQQQVRPPPPPKAAGADELVSTSSSGSVTASSGSKTESTSKLSSKSSLRVSARPFIPSSFRMQQAQPKTVEQQQQQVPQQAQQQQQLMPQQRALQAVQQQQHAVQPQQPQQQQAPQQMQQHLAQHQVQAGQPQAHHQQVGAFRPQQQQQQFPPQQQQQQQMSPQQQLQQSVSQQQQPQQQPMMQQQYMQQQQLAYMQYQQQLQYQQQMYASQQQRHPTQQQQQQPPPQQQQQHQQQGHNQMVKQHPQQQQAMGLAFKQQQPSSAGPAPQAAMPRQHQHMPGGQQHHQQQQQQPPYAGTAGMNGAPAAGPAYSSRGPRAVDSHREKDSFRDRRPLGHQQQQQQALGHVQQQQQQHSRIGDTAAADTAAVAQQQIAVARQSQVAGPPVSSPPAVSSAAVPQPGPGGAAAAAGPAAVPPAAPQPQQQVQQPPPSSAQEGTQAATAAVVDNSSSSADAAASVAALKPTERKQEEPTASADAAASAPSSTTQTEHSAPQQQQQSEAGPKPSSLPGAAKAKLLQQQAAPSGSRSWSSIAAKPDASSAADADGWPAASTTGGSPRTAQSSSQGGASNRASTAAPAAAAGPVTGSSSSSGGAPQPLGSWRSGTDSLKSKLQRDGSGQHAQQAATAAATSAAGKTAAISWPALGGQAAAPAAAADGADTAAAGSSPRAATAAAGSWARSVGSSGGGSATSAQAPVAAAAASTAMARNSSSGSLKGQEAVAGKQQQQQPSRLGKQGSGGAYGGNSGIRLDHAPSKITITNEHGIVFEGPPGILGSQRLVRGLYNEGGQYNCFLNVIIQALWHLRSFRQRLLQLPAAATASSRVNGPASKGSTPAPKGQQVTAADLKILQALRAVFDDLAKSPELPADQQQAAAAVTAENAASKQGSTGGQWLVNPTVLREALSGLELGATAIPIKLSEMHDASEVLNEVFTALHRAEAGRATGIADDPHLPTKVKVKQDVFALRKQGAAAQPAAQQPAQQQPQQPLTLAHILQMQNGTMGNGPATMNGIGSKSGLPGLGVSVKAPNSLVHKLFGLDVLQAHAADAGVSSRGAAAVKKAAAGGKEAGSSQVEALQFMKFFHLMPAQALRAAYDRYFDTSFEVVLHEAEAADHSSSNSSNAGSWTSGKPAAATADGDGGGLAPGGTCTVLLRRPAVFTLAVVWESPKAPLDSIKGTVNALGPCVELSQVFGGISAGAPYNLRSVICYFGHHYQAFVLSEELQQWLLFDDHVIKVVGDWQQVKQAMINNRLQPSLLFFEAQDA